MFGFALTALFAISSVYLRGYLEDKLIGEVLQQNLADYANKFYVDPNDKSHRIDMALSGTVAIAGLVWLAWERRRTVAAAPVLAVETI